MPSQVICDVESMMPEHCKTAVPIKSHYQPTGVLWNLADMQIYETRNKPRRMLISVYDIFAFHENTKQFADVLAAQGDFRVVIPDFLRGPVADVQNFPPKE